MAKSAAILGLFALLVVIIVGIALTVYFTTKKSGEKASETSDKPELTFDLNAKKTINPQEEDSGTQEEYAIEYAGGEAINLTLSWNNGQGFDGVVNKLIFTRYVGGKKIQDDKETEKAGEIADNGSGSVTFAGTDVSDGVDTKGVNVIKAYYNEVKDDNQLASVELEITEDDFDRVMTGEFSEVVIPVTIKEDSFKLRKFIKKTYYSISHAPDYWFEIEQSGGNFKFKQKSGMYLGIGGLDVFKLQKYKGRLIIMNVGTDKVYVPGQGMRLKTEMTSEEYWLAQCDLIGASLITGNYESVRQGIDFVSPNKQFFAIYQTDGNFAVYKGSGSSDNKGAVWLSGTNSFAKNGQIVMRPQYNKENYAALSFSSTKDLGGGNIKKEMISTNTGVKPYKLLISDVGRLVVTDSNGKNMVMGGGGDNLQYFFQSTHGSVCGSDLPHFPNGGGNGHEKQNVCAKKCYETEGCIGYVMNDNTCFPKKANFLNTGTHTSQGCINAHEKKRLNNTDKYDHTGFKYRAGRCDTVPKPGGMHPGAYQGVIGKCATKQTPEACVRSNLCAWNPVNSSKKYSSYHTSSGISEPGTIATFSN